MPTRVQSGYLSWPLLPEIFPVTFSGVNASRDALVVDIDREKLVWRMQQYFNSSISDEEIARICPRAMEDSADYNSKMIRSYLCKRGFLFQNIIRHCYRPFDVRWLYWEPETTLLHRNCADYVPHVFEGNIWISAAQRHRRDFDPPYICTQLGGRHVIERGANFFPLYLRVDHDQSSLFDREGHKKTKENLSVDIIAYIGRLNVAAEDLFYHCLAVTYSSLFRSDNADALRQDWPRVPLPDSKSLLLASAKLGRQVAALLDPESHVPGVTTGTIKPELKTIAIVTREGGGSLKLDAGGLDVTTGWGHAGKGGVTMPGKGKVVERDYTAEERTAVGAHGRAPLQSLGETTCDIYLNNTAYWKNVPVRVWEYTIGGYQVIKKWLSYRERDLLGRSLTIDEAREVTNIARRIVAILLMETELDASYQAVKQATYAWQSSAKE
jgi:hypothetical protein